MNKALFLLGFLSLQLHAQQGGDPYKGRVGINTERPAATLDINRASGVPATAAQGVLFPRFTTAERGQFTNVAEGTMIYNTTKKCVEIYKGMFNNVPQWSCCCSSDGLSDSDFAEYIAIASSGFTGNYISGLEFTDGNTVSFTITNNGLAPLKGLDLSQALSLTNRGANVGVKPNQNKSVDLASGESKKITFVLTGTPTTAGNNALTATFNYKGVSGTQSTNVRQGLTGNFVSQTRHEVSLNYKNIQVQGKLKRGSRQFSIDIPYTGATVGTEYIAVNITKATAPGQNNDVNNLTLSIPAGRITAASGNIRATISIDGDGEYLIKQLNPMVKNDVNGLYEEYVIADFPVNLSGARFNITLKGISGVPDRLFGERTNGVLEHQFVYVPVKDNTTGKVWLNHNLGAEYTRVGSPDFDPLRERSDNNGVYLGTDYKAFGSLFQWQRKADGHELGTWTSDRNRSHKYSTSENLATSWTNTSNNFIKNPLSFFYWLDSTVYNGGPYNLWTSQGSNNPCPEGYYVPGQEFHNQPYNWAKNNNTDLVINITDTGGIITSYDNGINRSNSGATWSSRKAQGNSNTVQAFTTSTDRGIFDIDNGDGRGTYPSEGRAVRCVKN